MSRIIIAIDPGSAGAIAWKDTKGEVHCEYMPGTPMDILNLFRNISSETDNNGNLVCKSSEVIAYLEDVGAGRPGQAVGAMTKFARHNGHLEAFLLAEGFVIRKVLPNTWMKTLGLGSSKSCKDKTEWKNKLKAKSQELFPQFNVTAKNQDALLILDYANKIETKSF